MPFEAAIDELLNRACPSIRYRIRAEILNEARAGREMRRLQAEILEDGAVREVAGWQQPDGWLGRDFHGANSIETGIRLLCEKGVEREQPVLARALCALANASSEQLSRGIGRVGGSLDEMGLGGSQMIRAAVLAYAGVEDLPCVQTQIGRALAGFAAVLNVHSEADLFEIYRGKRVIRAGIAWPSLYHLRLLAHTQSWRTPERLDGLAQSVQRLVELSPVPEYNAQHGTQLIAPASFCMHDFRPALAELDAAGWMMEFQRLELSARLGVVSRVAALQEQVSALEEIRNSGVGLFRLRLNHAYFKKWGAYTGLMLESDWREARRRMYDLTFRVLLISHFAGWKGRNPENTALPGEILEGIPDEI